MNINIEVKDTVMTIALEGRLDTLTVPELESELKAYSLSQLTEITVDAEKLDYISSAGLRVLLQAYKSMKMGGVLRVINANQITREVFRVTGFEELFTIE